MGRDPVVAAGHGGAARDHGLDQRRRRRRQSGAHRARSRDLRERLTDRTRDPLPAGGNHHGLLPRVAARTAKNEDSLDILFKSVAATAVFCLLGIFIYWVAGPTIVRLAFGANSAAAAPLLWRFGVAMGGFAVLSVLLIYHLGRDQSRMSWLLAGGAVAQVIAFLFIHGSARQLIAVDVAAAAALLIGHEVLFKGLLSRSIVAGIRHAVGGRGRSPKSAQKKQTDGKREAR